MQTTSVMESYGQLCDFKGQMIYLIINHTYSPSLKKLITLLVVHSFKHCIYTCNIHGEINSMHRWYWQKWFIDFLLPCFWWLGFLFFNKGSLFKCIVPLRTFSIHGTFPLRKSFYIVVKDYFDFLNVLHTKKKNGLLKSSLGNQNKFF